ncbi:hypothetical protein BUALT_Bualt15G0026600 [Buddleja alternifolia]|uniref:ditrans,polycis-polyprenyl diphosphate synthase [(2E,6E)-farnesyldiphosphate specific] n=1 Tax=Buddleja alternifolia TaxID=168488 RepID=A0AAV6WMV3_9LAMI|nr:hypothetical protein BUALT_Bualt15G0026600 [Buddleja alternifolia]
MQKVYAKIRPSGNHGRRFLWNILHLIFSIWYYLHGLVNAIESLLISSGLFQRYKSLDISKVRYLAVVIDSEEALNTLKVLELLRWLQAIGLKHVCLYDTQGLLKISKEALALWLESERMSNETTSEPLEQKCMSVDVLSFSDGKHAVAKATNFLLKKHYLGADTEKKTNLTESDMTDALGATGYGGADPDLMLVYGPARCHMGFPAWRLRYTEIVHMGPLKSMKFGALIKAIHRFTMVHQNYDLEYQIENEIGYCGLVLTKGFTVHEMIHCVHKNNILAAEEH